VPGPRSGSGAPGLVLSETVRLPALHGDDRPVLGPDGVFVFLDSPTGGLVKLSRQDYRRLWQNPDVDVLPARATSEVLFCRGGRRYEDVCAVDANAGRVLWTQEAHRGDIYVWKECVLLAPAALSTVLVADPLSGVAKVVLERPRKRLLGLWGDRLVLGEEAPNADDESVAHVAVIDLSSGGVCWQQALAPLFPPPAEDHTEDVFVSAVAAGVLVVNRHDHYRGLDLESGAVLWQVYLDGVDGEGLVTDTHLWVARCVPGGAHCVDLRTGVVTQAIVGPIAEPSLIGTWHEYAVSATRRSLDLLHPSGRTFRIALSSKEDCTAVAAGRDLILNDGARLRILRTPGTRRATSPRSARGTPRSPGRRRR
jgi:hypothetical protein